MNFDKIALQKISENIHSSFHITESGDFIAREFSEVFSGAVRIHLTDTLRSDIGFGDHFNELEKLEIPKKTLPWYARSTIHIKYEHITFSAIKNGFVAITHDERAYIETVIALCEKHLSTHPLKRLSNLIKSGMLNTSLKLSGLIDNSSRDLEKQFYKLEESILCLQSTETHSAEIQNNISRLYRTYNKFKNYQRDFHISTPPKQ